MLDMDERISQFLVDPETVACCDQMSPAPPAWTQSAMTTATDVTRTMTVLNTKNQRSLCGGIRRKGNWRLQKRT